MKFSRFLIGAALVLTTGCANEQASRPATVRSQANDGTPATVPKSTPAPSTPKSGEQAAQSAGGDLTMEQGKTLFENACSGCHDLSMATQKTMSKAMWRYEVLNMIDQGAPLNDQEADLVIDYLATTYGGS